MTDESDEQLMLRYQGGDESAFESLYQKHKGPLYRYLLRSCKVAAVSDELFQDVWMKVIHARDRYEPKAKFTTYLYHLAHNRLIDHYRRSNIRVVESDTEEAENTAAIGSQQPEQLIQRHEQLTQLLALIEQLPDDQREAFLLKHEAAMTVAEIAQVTGVGQETAKSRLRYAFGKLREGMKQWL